MHISAAFAVPGIFASTDDRDRQFGIAADRLECSIAALAEARKVIAGYALPLAVAEDCLDGIEDNLDAVAEKLRAALNKILAEDWV